MIWIATYSGLSMLNPKSKSFSNYTLNTSVPRSISSPTLNCVIEDHNGVIWVGGNRGGVSRFDSSTGGFINYKNDPADPQSIGNNFVTTLCEDRSGVLWVGTNGGGLNKVSLNKEKFTVYKNYDPQPRTRYILAMFTSHDGKIWIGTLSGGFFCFDPATKKFTRWHWDEFDMVKGPLNSVYGFDESRDGSLWIVTAMNGLLCLNRKTNKLTVHHSLAATKGLTKIYNQFLNVCIDSYGKLWMGSLTGIDVYDPVAKIFNHYATNNHESILLNDDSINSLLKDDKGCIWIGGAGSGLTCIDTRTKKIKNYRPHKNDPDSLSDDEISTLAFDKSGYLWLANNGGGLSVFDIGKEIFRTFSMDDGLPSNVVKGLLVDNCNNLWISTGNGISKCSWDQNESPFNAKLKVRNYDIANGPGSNDFSYNACTKGRDGTLYFGSLNGLVAFNPDSLLDNAYKPPVVLTEFLLNNKPVYPADGSLLKNSITIEKEIKLNYRQNVIGFTFAALSYDHPEQNKYAYKLDGFDKDWNYTSASQRTVTYTNLRPAKYIFWLKATNNDGIWNETPTKLILLINPPFWQTWWFYSLCSIFAAAVLYAIYRYRLRQVLRLQMIRNNIASDLHDDIGSTLNSISIFSEVAKQQAKGNIPALEEIGISSRKVIDSMSDIVWTINPENDSFEKIIQRMRSFAFQLLRAKGIEMVFKTDQSLNSISLPMLVRKNFYLIFKEATNNLVKYSCASRAIFLINHSSRQIRVEIRDNGKGFDINLESQGNGIKNMRRRADEIKASLTITSVVNEGTSLELVLQT